MKLETCIQLGMNHGCQTVEDCMDYFHEVKYDMFHEKDLDFEVTELDIDWREFQSIKTYFEDMI